MNLLLDFDTVFNTTASIIAILLLLIIPIPEALKETSRPTDRYTRLRWILLTILAVIVILGLPSIFYTIGRIIGNDIPTLRSIANICGGLLKLAVAVGFTIIYKQKISKD